MAVGWYYSISITYTRNYQKQGVLLIYTQYCN